MVCPSYVPDKESAVVALDDVVTAKRQIRVGKGKVAVRIAECGRPWNGGSQLHVQRRALGVEPTRAEGGTRIGRLPSSHARCAEGEQPEPAYQNSHVSGALEWTGNVLLNLWGGLSLVAHTVTLSRVRPRMVTSFSSPAPTVAREARPVSTAYSSRIACGMPLLTSICTLSGSGSGRRRCTGRERIGRTAATVEQSARIRKRRCMSIRLEAMTRRAV